MVTRAAYIDKNNSINQEFFFAHPETKFELNRIYNSHFTGSCLWDLFSKETKMVENSWNVSFRIMYGLPRTTHRYFVEKISKKPHVKNILIRNFLNFISQIRKSAKTVAKDLLNLIEYDVESVTGSNLRNIMQLLEKDDIKDLTPNDAKNIVYHEVPLEEEWRIGVLQELLEVRQNEATLDNFSYKDINDMIELICVT